ncbi:MAG: hypothetical protein GC147_02115 [Porphyrobacter sp.]|nr:hypothetical protein [Porphyrobacter sp.]
MRKTLVLLAPLIALGAAPAAAELRTAPLEDIFESYNDCFAATNGGALDPAELEKLGWSRATISSRGKPVEGGPVIFGHGERAPIILLSGTEGAGICIVNARIKNFSVFTDFTSAFGGKLPKPDKDGEINFIAEGRPVQIAPTGSRDKPAMRLVVMTPTENK